MNRLDYYFRQRVTESELDEGFTYCEDADHELSMDNGLVGICAGLDVAQNTVPNLTVDVALGVAYDQNGQRCHVPATQDVDCSKDYNGVSTSVVSAPNEKWISIFIGFTRVLSDPRTDGNSETVYFERAEGYVLRVVQGAEALIGYASKPALDPERVLLCDIRLTYGKTTILNADINVARRQVAFDLTGTPVAYKSKTAREAIQSVLDTVNGILGGSGGVPATGVSYAGGPAWYDGTTNPAATAEAQFDKIISDLSLANLILGSGSDKVGSYSISGSPTSLSTGSVRDQIIGLLTALNARGVLAGANTWSHDNTFNGQSGDLNPALKTTTTPALYFKTLWEVTLSTSPACKMRLLAGNSGMGLALTVNCYYNGSSWTRDNTTHLCRYYTIDANGISEFIKVAGSGTFSQFDTKGYHSNLVLVKSETTYLDVDKTLNSGSWELISSGTMMLGTSHGFDSGDQVVLTAHLHVDHDGDGYTWLAFCRDADSTHELIAGTDIKVSQGGALEQHVTLRYKDISQANGWNANDYWAPMLNYTGMGHAHVYKHSTFTLEHYKYLAYTY